ncbi:MAG: TIGR01777 family oxidoreductase [Planctomycetota bacterium]|nr:TIGR01777 family oxidoreductase [Planctomycetota bacterium]
MRALVTGATGFVGTQLLRQLDRPIVLTRNVERAKQSLTGLNATAFAWDPMQGPPPAEAFDGVDVVFHLAGESVAAGRWTNSRKKAIRESRVQGTRNLVEGLIAAHNRPRVLVSASAIGYYGSRGDEVLNEDSTPADDFLAEVCVAWEREAHRATQVGVRVVPMRIGLVLGKGGALSKMLPPFKFGLGGKLGNGQQWMSWVHVADAVGLLLHAAKDESVDRAMNTVAPHAIRNAEFTTTLASELHRPAIFPLPYFAARAIFGEFAQVLFASQRIEPHVATQTGYQFQFPKLQLALHEILHTDK